MFNDSEFVRNFEFIPNKYYFTGPIFVAVSVVLFYLFLYFMSKYMQNRKAYDLKVLNILHNFFLAILSFVMAAGIIEELIRIVKESTDFGNFCSKTYCLPHGTRLVGPLYFWSYIYHCSKTYELLDSLFIILRKKHTGITVLHVFHHSIMLFQVLEWFYGHMTFVWFATWINSSVHVIMYVYYALSIMGIKFKYRFLITIIQLIQFFLGAFWIIAHLVLTQFFHWDCVGNIVSTFISILTDSYIIYLFWEFYVETYMKKGKDKGKGATEDDEARKITQSESRCQNSVCRDRQFSQDGLRLSTASPGSSVAR